MRQGIAELEKKLGACEAKLRKRWDGGGPGGWPALLWSLLAPSQGQTAVQASPHV
jgi:hypothetical protein